MSKSLSPMPLLRRLHERQYGERNLIKTVVRASYVTWALFVAVVLIIGFALFKPGPVIPDTTADFNRLTRVQFFAENYTTIWLTGTERDVPAIKQMTADELRMPPKWNPEPMEVSDLNVADIRAIEDDPYTEWIVTMGATITAPGTANPQRAYYDVTIIERDGALRALTMPRPVNFTRPPLSLNTTYVQQVAKNTALGTAVVNFIQAYYTRNASGSLGRYVSSGFDSEPLNNSPYTSAEVLSIKTDSKDDLSSAKAGQGADILVTVKVGTSLTTYHTIDAPLRVTATDNGQWLVDEIRDVIQFDKSSVYN